MKNKIVVVALIAAVLMAGLVLAGCGKICPGGGDLGAGERGKCKYTSASSSSGYVNKDCEDGCIREQLWADDRTMPKDSFSCNCSS